jgi:hypothetical protein
MSDNVIRPIDALPQDGTRVTVKLKTGGDSHGVLVSRRATKELLQVQGWVLFCGCGGMVGKRGELQ